VYHEKMELEFPDLTIRTTGSVGVADESLDIMAEMTVPPKWLVNNTTLNQAMRNQLIRLPLRGTLRQPKLDQRALEQESAKFIRKAAGNILQNELNKGIDQLFKQ
jgi:translocation and assembly module TamB